MESTFDILVKIFWIPLHFSYLCIWIQLGNLIFLSKYFVTKYFGFEHVENICENCNNTKIGIYILYLIFWSKYFGF